MNPEPKELKIRTIDANTAGEPLRLIVDGFPRVQGRTMLERREWVRENCDHLRTALMLEPRGHADMYGALQDVITEFWNTPTMDVDTFVENYAAAMEAAS